MRFIITPLALGNFKTSFIPYTHSLTARFTSPVTNSVQGFMINYINNYGANSIMCRDYSCGNSRNDSGDKAFFAAINITIIA